MHFEQIPAFFFLLADARLSGDDRKYGVGPIAGEARAGEVQRRAGDGARFYLVAQFELAGPTEHAAHSSDAIGHEEKINVFDVGLRRAQGWVVPVHLAESRNEKLARSVDALSIGGNFDCGGGADLNDPITRYEDSLMGEYALGIHWENGDVDKCAGRRGAERATKNQRR